MEIIVVKQGDNLIIENGHLLNNADREKEEKRISDKIGCKVTLLTPDAHISAAIKG